MYRYYRFEDDNIYCKSTCRFPAVYAFYDEYGNILYIGKTNDLGHRMGQHYAVGHLKDYQYKQVRKVMFHRCKNNTDAVILEAVLLAYYKPLFNKHDKGDLPTIVDVDEVISSLNWEVYFDDTCCSNEEKIDLYRELISFDVWCKATKVNFLESAYMKYIVRHKNDTDENLKREYEILFEMVLVRYIGAFNNSSDRRSFCDIIRQSYLPDIEYKWFDFCKKKMNVESYKSYGDIYQAFADNPSTGQDCIEHFRKLSFVILGTYNFEKAVSEPDGTDDFDEFDELLEVLNEKIGKARR